MNVEAQEALYERILCSRVGSPGRIRPQLGRFLDRIRPKGCVAVYLRAFEIPGQPTGPIVVGTGTLAMKDRPATRLAWRFAPLLLAQLMENHPPKEVAAPARIGAATRLFHTSDPPSIYPLYYTWIGRTASFLVWRTGKRIAVVMATGESFSETDRAAVELARRQQAHLRKPTRYTRSERFDGEVGLDDPELGLPVYWLGRNFRPGGALPDNRLFRAYGLHQLDFPEGVVTETPGGLLWVDYRNIRLTSWTSATWPQYRRTRAGNAIVSWRCTKKRRITRPDGYAVIYGGYEKNYRRCPAEPPSAFTARVYIDDLVIAVNPIWYGIYGFIETVNPYGSFNGMEAIVRGLRLRPKRWYQPAG